MLSDVLDILQCFVRKQCSVSSIHSFYLY